MTNTFFPRTWLASVTQPWLFSLGNGWGGVQKMLEAREAKLIFLRKHLELLSEGKSPGEGR